jgi:DnaA-homolog protein
MRQIPLDIGSAPSPSFESFLPAANQAALAHLRDLTPDAAPAYLWGVHGSGKTHLLRALNQRWCERGLHVAWYTPADLTPWEWDDRWSLVVLDNCHKLDADQQQAAFTLFVHAADKAVPIVAAGDVPPIDLPLREDLRTRLGWGHVFALVPPTEAETRAVLRREADRRGVLLSDEVMDHLLRRFARDLSSLMSMLARLDHYSLSTKRSISVALLKDMLAQEEPVHAPSAAANTTPLQQERLA